jgi:hypothetical protein
MECKGRKLSTSSENSQLIPKPKDSLIKSSSIKNHKAKKPRAKADLLIKIPMNSQK